MISGNIDGGISLDNHAFSNTVAFNFVGTTPNGQAALGNSCCGIILQSDAYRNLVISNLVSGNNGAGILIAGSTGTSSNRIVANLIGSDLSGFNPLGNTAEGVLIVTGTNNEVGGIGVGQGNLIAFNGGAGIAVTSGTGHALRGNRIFNNSGLGIDLGAGGVTANDAGDGDAGPNNLQNFPVLTAALTQNGTAISGTLNSLPSTAFRVEFFANAMGDPSNHGEGQTFIGATTVTTSGSGSQNFTFSALSAVPLEHFVTATATDPAGNTSEFSSLRQVTDPDFDDDDLPNLWEVLYGLNPNNPADAYADSDGDGMANLQEFWAGTDPLNASSSLRFSSIALAGGVVCIAWPGQLTNVVVQSTSSLDQGGIWQDEPASSSPLCGPAANGQKYFRLVSVTDVGFAYSLNYVGYQNYSFSAGSNSVINPFANSNNSVGVLIPNPPDGTSLFTNLGSSAITFFEGFGWFDSSFNPADNAVLRPGARFYIYAPASFTLTLSGEVAQLLPEITAQSVSRSVASGTTVVLFALASGNPAPDYQWQFNGSVISGATNNSLVLSNFTGANAGSYIAVATNSSGATTSAIVVLTLSSPPTIFAQNPPAAATVTSLTQLTVTFSEDVQGVEAADLRINGLPASSVQVLSAATYQFSFPQPPFGSVAITWAINHGITSTLPPNAAFNSGVSGSQWSYTLAAQAGPSITSHPQSQNIVAGSQAALSVIADGTPPLSYQWLFNGTSMIPGATQATLPLMNVEPGASGNYRVAVSNAFGVVTSAVATLIVVSPPVITLHPQSQIAFAGANVPLSAAAHGSVPLGFQWFRNGQPLVTEAGNQSNSSLTIFDAQSADSGNYHVVITNAANLIGVTSFVATLNVLNPLNLGAQPAGTNVGLGGTAMFCVGATGTLPVQYQWRHNGANIPNATNACLTITNVQLADGGTYHVTIENPAGTAVSDDAALTISVPAAPPGDNFTNRVSLGSALTNVVSGTNRFATSEPGELLHAGKVGGQSVWYSWTAPANGIATFSTVGSVFDTLLAIYTGSTLTNLTSIAADEDSGGFFTSRLQFNAQAGTTYHIAIDGFADAEGYFILSWALEPTPEVLPLITAQPASRAVLPGSSANFTVAVTGSGLTYQWFFNGALRPGETASTLLVANVEPDDVGFYSVRVSNGSGRTVESDEAILEIGPEPTVQSQDKFEDLFRTDAPLPFHGFAAANLVSPGFLSLAAGVPLLLVVNNTNSTTESFEPTDCRISGSSRWLTMRMVQNGVCLIDTTGSSLDTTLSVYTGSNYLMLQPVTCDDNGAPDGVRSLVRFPALAGIDYRVRVDGVRASRGIIHVNAQLGYAPNILPFTPINPPVELGEPLVLQAPPLTSIGSTLRYQWRLDARDILAATNALYSLTALGASDAGQYSVRVWNEFDQLTQTVAVITLNIPYLHRMLRLTNGILRLTLQRPSLQSLALEGSDDLQTWTPVHTIPITLPGPAIDLPLTNQHRFYRARPWP
ncbi:MAG TPA: immunoglobulin domain-containing protein [Methylomirabilota bacterium]|nr:immunoglobulin domain-containing protein [Methylomirabilota bacterium]